MNPFPKVLGEKLCVSAEIGSVDRTEYSQSLKLYQIFFRGPQFWIQREKQRHQKMIDKYVLDISALLWENIFNCNMDEKTTLFTEWQTGCGPHDTEKVLLTFIVSNSITVWISRSTMEKQIWSLYWDSIHKGVIMLLELEKRCPYDRVFHWMDDVITAWMITKQETIREVWKQTNRKSVCWC